MVPFSLCKQTLTSAPTSSTNALNSEGVSMHHACCNPFKQSMMYGAFLIKGGTNDDDDENNDGEDGEDGDDKDINELATSFVESIDMLRNNNKERERENNKCISRKKVHRIDQMSVGLNTAKR